MAKRNDSDLAVHASTGNVFADLGLPHAREDMLKVTPTSDKHTHAYYVGCIDPHCEANSDAAFRAERRAEKRKTIWLCIQLFGALFALASSIIVAGRIIDNA